MLLYRNLCDVSDSELIARCRTGDANAWDALVLRTEKAIHQYAYSLCRCHDDADDITGQVLLRLYRNLHTFRNEASFHTWLFRIIRNIHVDACEYASNRRCLSLDTHPDFDASSPEAFLLDPSPSPESLVIEQEMARLLGAAVGHLPVYQRQVLRLYYQQRRSYDEIALLTGLPLGTVKSRLSRARRMLQARLEEDADFREPEDAKRSVPNESENRKTPEMTMEKEPETSVTKQQARKLDRTQKAIGESEEWLFTTLQSIGDAVIATDAAGCIVFMNPVAVSLTGWSEEEAEGRDCREVFHIVNETTRKETESPVAKVMRDGVIAGLANHTILISRDGAEHSIDDSGSPIRGRDGELIGVVLIFRDITDRRETEQLLQEQKNLLQTLFDHIPVIVSFLDDAGQFKWVNREWTRVLGWSLAEMQDPTLHPALPSSGFGSQLQAPAKRPAQGWSQLKLNTKAGNALVLSWALVRLSDGTCIGIGQMYPEGGDAMAPERLARLESRNLRLEQAMRETDHRVKNNLQSIAALLDIQVMENEEAVPVRELAQIRMHIVTLASIHDLLVQDVRVEGPGRLLSVKKALQALLPMLQQLVGKHSIRWNVDDVQLPIKQGMSLAVLINELVHNAVKHGGTQVELRLAQADERVTLEVFDDGPGFSEQFHPRDAAHFGLELVESVSRLDLGGNVSYENRLHGGACVRVAFPLTQQPRLAG